MSDWLVSIAGTPAGSQLALGLALFAALMHAIFGALQKGRHDPWLTRGAIDFSYGLMAMPIALFVVPWPEPHMWLIFAGMFVIHVIYKITQGMAYSHGAYTVVYPVVRGLGPLVTVIAAGAIFGEHFEVLQWSGLGLLTLAIFALAAVNLRRETVDRGELKLALIWAVAGGFMVAAYTTYDAYGIRATLDPFTFLAWFFFIDGLLFPFVAFVMWCRMDTPPEVRPLMVRGFIGGIVAYLSFGSIMMATRLDKVGEAAVLRETSPVFAALIGWFFLKEKVGPLQAFLMCAIAGGAVLVEFGG
ncbi:EamA family transporter [Amylibacter sp. SFDW26]|uniref:EamA family transporter n=1 Tax=Amylibacter sp. SFDW26 TaxID=2652722 RepID=UPI00126151F8|nr:EamA family transporter [Amylibacter sp. SFDW26]KAB7615507.1 EamA family transporter [Amylibacter sp. SFDW26]